MADLLTHVLVAYVLATLLSWRDGAISPRLTTLAMAGAVIPDLSRMELVVPAASIETALGVPFSWAAFHRVGGAAIVVLIGALAVPPRYRRRALVLLAIGAGSHFALDTLTYSSTGVTRPFLWPLTDRGFATPGLYVSSERWPALLSAVAATTVCFASGRRNARRGRSYAREDRIESGNRIARDDRRAP